MIDLFSKSQIKNFTCEKISIIIQKYDHYITISNIKNKYKYHIFKIYI